MKKRIDWPTFPQGYAEVDAKPVTFPGYEAWAFFVAELPNGGWAVSEESTGASLSSAGDSGHSNRNLAIVTTALNLAGSTPRKFARMIAKSIKKHGPISERTKPRTVVRFAKRAK